LVSGTEDRSPDLRLSEPPSQFSHEENASGIWPDSFCLTLQRLDGSRVRCAHSCGAVADFHRLPEHPGESPWSVARSHDAGCAESKRLHDFL